MRFFLIFLISLLLSFPAAALDENWREDAREMLTSDKKDGALFLMEKTAGEARNLTDPLERVNALRFLGELFWLAGKKERGQGYFSQALELSLGLSPVWKRLSAVLSVLELHRAATRDISRLEPLLEATLQARLLPEMAKNHHASEIGRYVKTFDGADRATFAILLEQLRHIGEAPVRVKALFAVSEIAIGGDSGHFIAMEERPPYDADAFEKLLWHVAMARLFDAPASRSNQHEHQQKAKNLLDTLPKDKQTTAKKVLKGIAQP